jgi:ribose transport system substrate-binding protein
LHLPKSALRFFQAAKKKLENFKCKLIISKLISILSYSAKKGGKMKKNVVVIVILVVLAAVFVGIGISRKGGDAQSGGSLTIGVVPKGLTHVFWQSVKAGAQKACDEIGAQMYWNGPEVESDRDKQIQIVEDLMIRNVSGVVLAPLDAEALVPVVEKLYEKAIPCAIIDSGIETDKYLSFISTDNYLGGQLAARRMGEILGGEGNVIVIKYAQGSDSTTQRENGFIETIEKEFPGIKIVDAKYGLTTVETALQATEDLLTKNQDVDGLFACNASTSVGALRGLESQGRTESIKMVGFDDEDAIINGLVEGKVDSIVVQNPFMMGYEGVKAVIASLEGRPVEKRIDTGVKIYTADDLDDSQVRKALRLE